jgi:hypothetical protein
MLVATKVAVGIKEVPSSLARGIKAVSEQEDQTLPKTPAYSPIGYPPLDALQPSTFQLKEKISCLRQLMKFWKS